MIKYLYYFHWNRTKRTFWPISALIFLLISTNTQAAMLYKNYLVRYDRGWDILCDPYRVQQGDWVLKIFRQKGEISHYDFREFLGIFQRLNPHIKDIDRIRTGQVVDIPLKKLAQGNLPGQSSGVVTIPFVMLSGPEKQIEKHATTYTIQKGDTVSILIAKQFGGRYGSDTYNQGLTLFKAINPHIEDIHRIYAGQQIYMPDPAIREKNWYASLFDEDGNLTKQLSKLTDTADKPIEEKATEPEPETVAVQQIPSPPPVKRPDENSNARADAAQAMDGRLLNKGTLFLPMEKEKDFEIDLSQYPMIDLGYGEKVVFTTENMVMGVDLTLVQSYWDKVKVVQVPKNASSETILDSIFSTFSGETAMDQLAFEDGGTKIQVKAKWIRSHPSPDGHVIRHTCITLISSREEQTHDAIVRYLARNDILIKDVSTVPLPEAPPSEETTDLERIDWTDPKRFIDTFARTMGFTYSPGIQVSFPYAGVQIAAQSNLLSFGNGKEVLVDFGDLYGDAVKAIEATGLEILQFNGDSEPLVIIGHLMDAAGIDYTQSPVFYGANRPVEFNTAITVNGILVQTKSGQDRLFIKKQIPQLIETFLLSRKIRLVKIENG